MVYFDNFGIIFVFRGIVIKKGVGNIQIPIAAGYSTKIIISFFASKVAKFRSIPQKHGKLARFTSKHRVVIRFLLNPSKLASSTLEKSNKWRMKSHMLAINHLPRALQLCTSTYANKSTKITLPLVEWRRKAKTLQLYNDSVLKWWGTNFENSQFSSVDVLYG